VLLGSKAFSKTGLCNYCDKKPSWISAFLHPKPERSINPTIHLDDLDNIAAYFRISIGELLGAEKPGELSGDEQRLLHAFKALSAAHQNHFLAVLELASLAPRQIAQRALLTTPRRDIRTPSQPYASLGGSHGRPVSPDPAIALKETQAFLNDIIIDLSGAAAGQIPDRQIPGARPDQPQAGHVAE
jgi:hypothetical protein